MARICIATIASLSPYSSSRPLFSEPTPEEKGAMRDFEDRVWMERIHVGSEGHAFIPPMAFKYALATAARFKSIKIKGQGTATYTKHFEAGVFVPQALPLPHPKGEPDTYGAEAEWLFVDAQPNTRGGGRVWRKYPRWLQWGGDLEFLVADDKIPQKVFEEVLVYAGQMIGVGRFRPEKKGYYGRFKIEATKWSDEDAKA